MYALPPLCFVFREFELSADSTEASYYPRFRIHTIQPKQGERQPNSGQKCSTEHLPAVCGCGYPDLSAVYGATDENLLQRRSLPTVYTMDVLFQLDQLARAVQHMREIQVKNLCLPQRLNDVRVFAAERRVDELVSRVVGGSCAPIPPHLAKQLFTVPIDEELPLLLLPSAYAVNFPPSADDLPDLPPSPPPPLPFMSTDLDPKQNVQWKPSEDLL